MKKEYFIYDGIFSASEVLDILLVDGEIILNNQYYTMTKADKSFILYTYRDKERNIKYSHDVTLAEFLDLFENKFMKAKIPVDECEEPIMSFI